MKVDNETLRRSLTEIEESLSESTHALANALNDLLLQVACIQTSAPEPVRSSLGQVQRLGSPAKAALDSIRAIRDRISRLVP